MRRSFVLGLALVGAMISMASEEAGAQCGTCAAFCTSELMACQPEPTCADFAQCAFGSCTDGVCIETCASTYPSAETDTLLDCLTALCGPECGLPVTPFPTPVTLGSGIGPSISGSNVTWVSSGEIYLWDGSTSAPITSDPSSDSAADVSGNNVVWQRFDGNDFEIYLWDGSVIQQITDNDFEDFYPTLSGDRLAWSGRPAGPAGAYQIFCTRPPAR